MGTTGIELALGVVPLIIAGAEAYSKGWDLAKMAVHQKTKQEKEADFLRNLLYEMRIFQLLLKTLVTELSILSAEEKRALLDHDKEQWRSEKVSRALEERLHDAHDAFTDILLALLKTLDGLVRLSNDATQPDTVFARLKHLQSEHIPEGTRKERLRERFRFASNEKTRLCAMLKITQYNEKLQKLLEQASKAPAEAKDNSHRTGPPLRQSRELINALYATMSGCWSCNCTPAHEAKLCLLRYFSTPEDDSTIASLDMLISTVPTDGDQDRLWRESHVSIIAAQKRNEPHHTVTLEVDGKRRQLVKSLCSIVKEKNMNSVSIGIDFDGEALYRTRSRRKSLPLDGGPSVVAVQLDTLLEVPTWEMSLRRKRILAVILAHAVLNFCEGPWLNSHWSKQHISFFKDSRCREGVDLARPYLSTKFAKGAEDGAGEQDFLSLHQSPPILALGVLLLELELCQPIETQWQAQDMGEDGRENSNTNLTAAQRLLMERVDDLYEGYRAAIEACLKCDFMANDDFPSLDNDSFRRKIYDRIVAPLEDELEHCVGLSPNQLLEKEMPKQVV